MEGASSCCECAGVCPSSSAAAARCGERKARPRFGLRCPPSLRARALRAGSHTRARQRPICAFPRLTGIGGDRRPSARSAARRKRSKRLPLSFSRTALLAAARAIAAVCSDVEAPEAEHRGGADGCRPVRALRRLLPQRRRPDRAVGLQQRRRAGYRRLWRRQRAAQAGGAPGASSGRPQGRLRSPPMSSAAAPPPLPLPPPLAGALTPPPIPLNASGERAERRGVRGPRFRAGRRAAAVQLRGRRARPRERHAAAGAAGGRPHLPVRVCTHAHPSTDAAVPACSAPRRCPAFHARRQR
jgi:hypothetical protein